MNGIVFRIAILSLVSLNVTKALFSINIGDGFINSIIETINPIPKKGASYEEWRNITLINYLNTSMEVDTCLGSIINHHKERFGSMCEGILNKDNLLSQLAYDVTYCEFLRFRKKDFVDYCTYENSFANPIVNPIANPIAGSTGCRQFNATELVVYIQTKFVIGNHCMDYLHQLNEKAQFKHFDMMLHKIHELQGDMTQYLHATETEFHKFVSNFNLKHSEMKDFITNSVLTLQKESEQLMVTHNRNITKVVTTLSLKTTEQLQEIAKEITFKIIESDKNLQERLKHYQISFEDFVHEQFSSISNKIDIRSDLIVEKILESEEEITRNLKLVEADIMHRLEETIKRFLGEIQPIINKFKGYETIFEVMDKIYIFAYLVLLVVVVGLVYGVILVFPLSNVSSLGNVSPVDKDSPLDNFSLLPQESLSINEEIIVCGVELQRSCKTSVPKYCKRKVRNGSCGVKRHDEIRENS